MPGPLLALLLACSDPRPASRRGPDPGVDPGSPGESPGGSADPGADVGVEIIDGEDPSDAVFDLETIHRVALTMDPASWADIRDNPYAESWHEAAFAWRRGGEGDAEVVGAVGVRAFGAGSLVPGKPSLKISFDRYVDGQRWRELEQLKLDNSSQDAGFLNERIATAALRRLGLPAARTGWAEVEVNGEHAGFFVVLEPIDDRFTARWFGGEGALYGMRSGYWGQGLSPFADPLTWYEPQSPGAGDGSDLVALAEVVAAGSDEELAEVLDLDQFTAISVARSVLGGIDAFSADGNNFYLYEQGGIWRQIPWDLDADLGYPYAFESALAVDLRAPWDASPWSYNPVTGAEYTDAVLLRHLAMGVDVDALAAEMLAGELGWAAMDAEIVESAALIEQAVWDDTLGYGPHFAARVANLRLWLHQRLSRLAGRDVADCTPPAGALAVSSLPLAGTAGWGSVQADETYWGPGFSVGGDHACRGIFAHAPSAVVVEVPAGYARLTGGAGLQDWNQLCGDGASFSVEQGGATLWSSGATTLAAPAADLGEILVSPGPLTLRAAPNAEYSCDTTAWVDLYLWP